MNKEDIYQECDEIIKYIYDKANYFISNLNEYSNKTAVFLFEIKPVIKNYIKLADQLEQEDTLLLDKISIAITKVDQQTEYYSGWLEHKEFYSFIDFTKISASSQKEILNVILESFKHKLFGKTNHIVYWYPIYQLLLYGTEEYKTILNNYLSEIDITESQTYYDDVIDMINEHLGSPNLLSQNLQVNRTNLYQPPKRTESIFPKHVPKCPICDSEDLSKITTTKKVAKIALFGIFGMGDNGKTWRCNNCGSKF